MPWVKDGSGAVGCMVSCEPRVVMVMSNHCTWVGRKFVCQMKHLSCWLNAGAGMCGIKWVTRLWNHQHIGM